MTTRTRLASAAAASLLMLTSASIAAADENVALSSEATERQHSINLGVGTSWGSPSISYEFLGAGGHGLVLEASGFYRFGEDGDSRGVGGAIGYRWHASRQQDSGFLGVHVGYDRGRSPVTVTTDEMTETYQVNDQTFYVVGNFGKRWLLRTNFNITARLGAGYAHRSLDVSDDDAEIREGVFFMEQLIGLVPVTIDGELSVGYTF
jgi:hypothetical protein